MSAFESVIVPVDFSAHSRTAFAFANLFPDANHEVLHIVQPWPKYMQDVLFPYAPLGEDDIQIQHELVTLATKQVDATYQTDGTTQVIFGSAEEKLPQAILESPADVIVMGLFGERGGVPDAIGSNAYRVVAQHAKPVVLTRDDAGKPKVEKVLVCVDFSSATKKVYRSAIDLALRLDAQLETLFVVPTFNDDVQGALGARGDDGDPRKVVKKYRERVNALFERLIKDLDVTFSERADVAALIKNRTIFAGDIASTIVDRANSSDIDVIVVGNKNPEKNGILGQVAHQVIRRAPCHVMVVPSD